MSLENVTTILACLRIFQSLGGTASVGDFGRLRWPESPNWRRCPGKATKAAAGLCGRLCRRGVLQRLSRGIYMVTDMGRAWLLHNGPPPPTPSPWVPAAPHAPNAWAPAPPMQAWPPTMPQTAPVYAQPPVQAPQFPQAPTMPSTTPWPWPPPWWPR